MKKSILLSLMFCCFVITPLFAADANSMFKTSLEKIETLKKQGICYNVNSLTGNKKKKTVNAKVYMKGEKIRIETTEGITIIDGNSMYFYIEKEKTAMKMNIDADNVKQTTFDIVQDKVDELQFVEKSSKNGYACQFFKAKDKGKDIEYYLTDDYGFPTYIKEEKAETNITGFKVGGLSDNLFVLPKDVEVMDMSKLGGSFLGSLTNLK